MIGGALFLVPAPLPPLREIKKEKKNRFHDYERETSKCSMHQDSRIRILFRVHHTSLIRKHKKRGRRTGKVCDSFLVTSTILLTWKKRKVGPPLF